MTALARLVPQRLRDILADRSGAVGPFVAVLGVLLAAAAGLTLDVGVYYSGNRQLRSATEAAAMSAAMDPANARARAITSLTRNGYDASVIKTVEIGYYCANSTYAAGSRFIASGSSDLSNCPGSSIQNAVRLTTGKTGVHYMTGVLGTANPIPDLSAVVSAARIDEAGIAVTSDTLKLVSGSITSTLVNAVNGLLGGLLGVTLNLSNSELIAMMSNNVDAGNFFDNLAIRVGQTGTYNQLVQGTYALSDIANAAAAATSDATTAAALRRLGGLAGSYQVPLSGLFGLGVWKNMPVGEANVQPALRAGLNAYQLVAFAVEAGPGAINASNLVSVVVPGSTVVISGLVQGGSAQPRFSFGPKNETSVSTAQVRLQIKLGIGNISLLGGTVAVNSLPLTIDIAPALATITDINCSGTDNQAANTVVKVNAQTGLVSAYIGDVGSAAMTKALPAITTVNPVSLLAVNLLGIGISVTAKLAVGPVLGSTSTLTFGPGGNGTIGSSTVPGTSASVFSKSQVGATVSSLVANLGSGLTVNVSLPLVGCLLTCTISAVQSLVLGALLPALTAPLTSLVGTTVDPVLDELLAALGIEVGNATVWVTGARCGVPVLVGDKT